jgi:hypothetical protein
MITLSGLPYRAASPSHFEQVGAPVTLRFDGQSWLIAVRGVYGLREFKTREEAADLIAQAFTTARENLG